MRLLKNFKSLRDPERPRSSYIDQVSGALPPADAPAPAVGGSTAVPCPAPCQRLEHFTSAAALLTQRARRCALQLCLQLVRNPTPGAQTPLILALPQLKRDIITYYEYNDFMADAILNLFPFDEAVEFIQVLFYAVLQSSMLLWSCTATCLVVAVLTLW